MGFGPWGFKSLRPHISAVPRRPRLRSGPRQRGQRPTMTPARASVEGFRMAASATAAEHEVWLYPLSARRETPSRHESKLPDRPPPGRIVLRHEEVSPAPAASPTPAAGSRRFSGPGRRVRRGLPAQRHHFPGRARRAHPADPFPGSRSAPNSATATSSSTVPARPTGASTRAGSARSDWPVPGQAPTSTKACSKTAC